MKSRATFFGGLEADFSRAHISKEQAARSVKVLTELLKDADGPEPPPCFNRDPLPIETRRFGLDSQTGEVIEVVLSNEWFEDRCNAWRGTGIGPTPETTHYPQAHGWEPYCRQCKWKPEGLN